MEEKGDSRVMLLNDSVQEFGFNLPYEAAYCEPGVRRKRAFTYDLVLA